MANAHKNPFLSRPRRLGKSLFKSTINRRCSNACQKIY
ncbi:MAG: hypothetical protein MJZ31_07150 [Bacteroidales bacterium]|nr:hypothetical protein [Bacteroidales bacterium]